MKTFGFLVTIALTLSCGKHTPVSDVTQQKMTVTQDVDPTNKGDTTGSEETVDEELSEDTVASEPLVIHSYLTCVPDKAKSTLSLTSILCTYEEGFWDTDQPEKYAKIKIDEQEFRISEHRKNSRGELVFRAAIPRDYLTGLKEAVVVEETASEPSDSEAQENDSGSSDSQSSGTATGTTTDTENTPDDDNSDAPPSSENSQTRGLGGVTPLPDGQGQERGIRSLITEITNDSAGEWEEEQEQEQDRDQDED